MKFSIITPTYKRAEQLLRAVRSVQNQTYSDWEIIIINDSPTDTSYNAFASSINDPRIRYHVNERNMGVNYSRNRALDSVSAESKWVLFLDDDDYLSPDTLKQFHNLILTHPSHRWFMTNRALKNGEALTKAPRTDKTYSYTWQYLIGKQITGDATHVIATEMLHTVRFSRYIKQGEEWFFFFQAGLKEKIFYHDHNSTISDGYGDLNYRRRTKHEHLETLSILFYEGLMQGLAYHPTFIIYIFIRLIRIPFRSTA